MEVFAQYALKNQQQQTLFLLERAFPDNAEVQQGVYNLVSRKTQWKQRLEEKWANKRQPVFDEFDVRRTCYMYQVLQQEKDRLRTAQNMPNTLVGSREWFIKAKIDPRWDGVHLQKCT